MSNVQNNPNAAPTLTAPAPSIDFGAPQRSIFGSLSPLILIIIVKSAIKSLLANKLRSILAMLGIIIGVGAVIAMLAMGAGAQQQVLSRFAAMGTNLLVVRPGQRGTGGVMSGTQINLTLEDARALVSPDIAHLAGVTPVVGGNAQVKFMNQNSRTSVNGVAPPYFEIRAFEVERGRIFNDVECESSARVAVIGPVTATNLFGQDDPLEQTIKINGINFRVIGIMKSKGDQGWFNPDDQVIVPYSVAMQQLFGRQSIRNSVREIDLQADDDKNLDALQTAVTEKLRRLHRIQEGMPDDFEIRNQAEMLENASAAVNTFRILLGTIASISLLVGGIGIMNIMLVTVTERTREIGIRKAIGAKDRDILTQFVIEAVFMSGMGGLLGAGLGVGASLVIGYFAANAASRVIPVPVVHPLYVILAVTVSCGVGIFFGVYPAWKASRLDPIEALRYE